MLCSAMVLYRLITYIFLGTLTALETQAVREMIIHGLVETCLALTIFRSDLGPRVFSLFFALMFTKLFHWIASPRVESISWQHHVPAFDKFRLAAFLIFLAFVDSWAAWQCVEKVWVAGPSVLILFAFEFSILLVAALGELCRFVIVLIDNGYGGTWEAKSNVLFYVELASDFARLCLLITLFGVISTFFGVPLHLFRELYLTFNTLRQRVVRFFRYRKLVRNLHDRFPYATEQELDAADRQCIICREEMLNAKKLPCNHLFHL
jgi:E3 ubiquitin-protein ligase synoviolin